MAVSPPKSDSPPSERSAVSADFGTAGSATETAGTRHTVQEGDTLYSLAQRYYGDKEKFNEILKVNRELVSDAENLTPGTVLTIPELPATSDSAIDKAGS